MRIIITLFFLSLINSVFATNITGVVSETNTQPLPFSSILIKGSTIGTTANSKGFFTLQLKPGTYTLVCQHIGYKTIEKKIVLGLEDLQVDFTLELQQYNNTEVVVKANREDPAYEIIRKAIKKRPDYLNEIKKFQCDVYLKGQLQLRNYPKKIMGEKVDFEDGDTSKRKMIFLSETVARYSYELPNAAKVEVVSTKVSGNSNGFGFSNPQIISFYENNISVGSGLNPRGFISPISNNALNYYTYKFEGSFYENGKEISRIKVTPKRKFEPLFSGYISIIENEWRLQSIQLKIVKEQQLQFLDTLNIEQLYIPMKNTWVIKQQVIYPAGKFLGFDFFGNFVQVYDNVNIDPSFKKKFFDNTIIKFFDSSNKKSLAYWDSVRPIPLIESEVIDYKKKDSLEQARKDPKYLDSLDKVRNKVTISKLLLTGQNFNNEKKKSSFSIDPLIRAIGVLYNPAEGRVTKLGLRYDKNFAGRQRLDIGTSFRYGYQRKNLNPSINARYSFGKKYFNNINLAFGSDVFQFNNNNPISDLNNTLSSQYWQQNHMKTYMADFAKLSYNKGLGEGFSFGVGVNYQNRKPMDNVIDVLKNKKFTPNFPTELMDANITNHKAFSATLSVAWRPGSRYIEFPDRKINVGSKYPNFSTSITKGIDGILGSTVDYTKWKFGINDNLNFKIGGTLKYAFEMGGFLQNNVSYAPDYQHYFGNQTAFANDYMKSFQLLPYYQFSNTEKFYTTGHVEYHLNGLISNKIPGYRKLNWFFVLGANALYINDKKNYYEAFVSIENIFKVIRVDFIQGYHNNGEKPNGIRFTMPFFR
jgi:hypothetical protein